MSRSRVLADVATGLAAGWVGLRVKAVAEARLQPLGEQLLPPAPGQKELPGADPGGHGERMPPSVLYERLVRLSGRDPDALDADQVEAGAVWLHRGIGYGYPLAYSLLSRRVPAVGIGAGTVAGTALFGAFHATTLPMIGVQAPVSKLPRAWWVWEGGSHLVYAVAVDLVVRLVRRVTG